MPYLHRILQLHIGLYQVVWHYVTLLPRSEATELVFRLGINIYYYPCIYCTVHVLSKTYVSSHREKILHFLQHICPSLQSSQYAVLCTVLSVHLPIFFKSIVHSNYCKYRSNFYAIVIWLLYFSQTCFDGAHVPTQYVWLTS